MNEGYAWVNHRARMELLTGAFLKPRKSEEDLGVSFHSLNCGSSEIRSPSQLSQCLEFPLIKVGEQTQTSQLPGALTCLAGWLFVLFSVTAPAAHEYSLNPISL